MPSWESARNQRLKWIEVRGGLPSRQVRAFLSKFGVQKQKGKKFASAYEFESALKFLNKKAQVLA
jgi:hypothetical protein